MGVNLKMITRKIFGIDTPYLSTNFFDCIARKHNISFENCVMSSFLFFPANQIYHYKDIQSLYF